MPKVLKAKWVENNAKLFKSSKGKYRVLGFGIPADTDFTFKGQKMNTCPQALACKGVCYAKMGRYVMHNVVQARKHNLKLSLRPTFVRHIIADLNQMVVKSKVCKKPYNVVRLHDSGDFFSQEYLNNWATIAATFPHVIFYAYTKSLHLDMSAIPSNLRITRSQGGRLDKLINLGLPNSRIFSSHAARKRAKYVDGNLSDIPAIEGVTSIGLVFHGNKKMTPAQEKFFS
jgi:hypothetical protein